MEFSIIIPVKNELKLIPKTLPSYYNVNPTELLICTDKPCPEEIKEAVYRIAKACGAENKTRIIEVSKNPEWKYHQANVRRTGFHQAEYDLILTGDIDLVINRNVIKALNLVGKDNIGLVSLSQQRNLNTILNIYRTTGDILIRKCLIPFIALIKKKKPIIRGYMGLYALYKPYWLDSESEEAAKQIRGRKNTSLYSGGIGEDAFLRNCVKKKHRVLYLSDIGAISLRDFQSDTKLGQMKRGMDEALNKKKLLGVLVATLLRARPYYLSSYLKQKLRDGKHDIRMA